MACLTSFALAQQSPSLLPPASPPTAPTAVAAPPATPGGPAQLSRQDAETWLDGFMPYALQRGDVAGATIIIVKDGQVLLEKGYGFSDVAKRVPVDPRRTLFRPGSVSKLFTWTAVMQQVEAGKLNLDADVNQYLDFKIPPYQGKPITLRNIMTHTAGFEERIRGLITSDESKIGLEKAVKAWIPERVYAPGTTPAYSNYATALAGYIVQRVSGEPFETYLDNHIFRPLGMADSSFHQPLQAPLLARMSKGYPRASVPAKPYEFVGLSPAGSLATTATDMGRFMLAHLGDGAIGDARILRPETARMMHTTALTVVPPLHRMLLGFYEHDINGHRVIAHAGDTTLFHSELNLFMDDHVGMFVSLNSTGAQGAAATIRSALFEGFADRYFPGRPADGAVDAATAADHARAMAGLYDASRRSHGGFTAALGFLSQTRIAEDGKGSIVIPDFRTFGGATKTWREIAPFVWREVGGQERIAATLVDGKVVRFSMDAISPFTVFDRAPWWRSTGWLSPAVYAALGALLLTVLLWPTAAIVRRRFGQPLALSGRPLVARRAVRVAALLALLVPVGWMMIVQSQLNFAPEGALGAELIGMYLLTLVAFLGGLGLAAWNAWLIWRGGAQRGWFAKAWSVVLLLSFFVLLWLGWVFGLLSFHTEF
ncbi:beta-lactamase family protein [Sphingomonas sp. XMGL2]|uniref:Beta-lactamase family protein n=2 Tax=Sphingomonas quercus TaxID=2842451 RepID=A0ABS6BMI0_9SPHN|nr:beta-lactamase family protein [Sphingomonas quercus]